MSDVEQPPRKQRSESRQRRSMVAIRLLPDELQRLQRGAARHGVSLSAFVRSAALNAALGDRHVTHGVGNNLALRFPYVPEVTP